MENETNHNRTKEIAPIVQTFQKMWDVKIYESSIKNLDNCWYFLVRDGLNKYLIIASKKEYSFSEEFNGESIDTANFKYLRCQLSSGNAKALRVKFDFTKPIKVGKSDSYGFGDRLGNAGPAHLRAVRNTGFRPVLAQQSIRELNRTNRTAQAVLDAASWSVFQEGYTEGFGADADHLKSKDDIDRMAKAGYTMFTIDPSDHVVNEAGNMLPQELEEAFSSLPWNRLHNKPEELLRRYLNKKFELSEGLVLAPAKKDILTGMVKYGNVIAHTKELADYINDIYPEQPAELELSVDETELPTTPFEHFLIASELNRLAVELVSLAPRFCGEFEKGIDFKGDLDQFRVEYKQHLAIAKNFGGYKLSIHSGSDKFAIYEVIGALGLGAVHVKTAGTSYLEALRTVAETDPTLFREILSFSVKRFPYDKKTYHISADPHQIPKLKKLKGKQLALLLDNDHARQVLHVTYGSVLSGQLPESKSFKRRIMKSLEENETLYEKNLVNHFKKHLGSFNSN